MDKKDILQSPLGKSALTTVIALLLAACGGAEVPAWSLPSGSQPPAPGQPAQGALPGAEAQPAQQPPVSAEVPLSPENDIRALLSGEFGNYERLLTWNEFLDEIAKANVLAIGESHFKREDMETIRQIVQELAGRRTVVLAVERFSAVLQPQLEAMAAESLEQRMQRLEGVFISEEYQKVWGSRSAETVGVDYDESTSAIFEDLMRWAASANIPIVGLDVSLEERSRGLGDDIPYRNAFWAGNVMNFLRSHTSLANPLVIVIGGERHISNAVDSFPSKMWELVEGGLPVREIVGERVLSVGQRNSNVESGQMIAIEELSRRMGLGDIIIKKPEFALMETRVVAQPFPPDFWIVVH